MTDTISCIDEISSLRSRNAELEREIALLRRIADPQYGAEQNWIFTRAEFRLLMMLLDGGVHSVYDLAAAITTKADDSGVGSVRVVMCRVRKKIAPIKINLVRSRGYQMDPEAIAAVYAGLESRS